MPEIITSPDFDRIRLGNDRATEDAVRLLWLMVNDLQARLRRVGGGSSALEAHDLLSIAHEDTLTAVPLPGSIIIGSGAAAEQDNSKFWGDGATLTPLLTSEATGGVKFWGDGGAFEGISEFSGTFWQRLAPPTVLGSVLTAGATGIAWEEIPPAPPAPPPPDEPDLPPDPYIPPDTVAAGVYFSTTTAIPALTQTMIAWDVEEFDQGGLWTSTSPTRLTAPSDGLYKVIAHTSWYYGTDEAVVLELFKNAGGVPTPSKMIAHSTRLGALTAGDGYSPPAYESHEVSKIISLTAGDYIECAVMLRYSGAAEELIGGQGYTYFQMLKVG